MSFWGFHFEGRPNGRQLLVFSRPQKATVGLQKNCLGEFLASNSYKNHHEKFSDIHTYNILIVY